MRMSFVATVLTLLCMGGVPVASAHGGESGPLGKQYVEKTDGERLVRIGIDAAQLVRGTDVQIDVAAIDHPDDSHWTFADYDRVTLSVLRNGSVMSEQEGAPSKIGSAVFVLRFAKAGVHQLHVHFEKNGSPVAEAELPVSVSGSLRIGRVVGLVSTYIQVLMVMAFLAFLAAHLFDRKAHPSPTA